MIALKKTPILIRNVFSPSDGPFFRIDFDFKYIQKSELDILFATSYADKAVAPLVAFFCENEGLEYQPEWSISEDNKKQISSIILSYYKFKWEKYIEAMELEYDPIHNFSDNLSEKINDNGTKNIELNGSGTQTGSGVKTREDNLTSTDTKNLTTKTDETIEDKMQGFNSTSYKPRDNEISNKTETQTGTDTVVDTGTQTNTEERDFKSTTSENSNITDKNSREREVKRTGNIGNITTQSMLNQEFDLWKRNFIREVLNDVKLLLTLPIYPS